jgi:hypothetical protein
VLFYLAHEAAGALHTRLRVRRASGAPRILCFGEGDLSKKLGQFLPRECLLLRIRLFDNQINSVAGDEVGDQLITSARAV